MPREFPQVVDGLFFRETGAAIIPHPVEDRIRVSRYKEAIMNDCSLLYLTVASSCLVSLPTV